MDVKIYNNSLFGHNFAVYFEEKRKKTEIEEIVCERSIYKYTLYA